ncbi:sortase [Actinoplanes sp. KI2]|uniref:sortase domain-containing protein n=1 Tax=Actinoplanes sp. KI2 TaxID=2983315 RepID=UPI0021D5A71F|nr:sortase [Actinoplanes sp. KI2]MCU7723797.1 sortase [Actinoplanes sp. KI2]
MPRLRAPAPDAAKSREKPDHPVRKEGLGGRAALPFVAAVLAAFVVGTAYVAVANRAERPETDPDLGRWAATAQPVEGAGNAARTAGDPFASDPFASAGVAVLGEPTRLRIKTIGLDSPLETLHVVKSALQPPKRFDRAGWYAEGTAPGDTGPAVIAGHVDSKAGPAIFYRLRELVPGDKIEVLRGGTVVAFTVTRTAWYPKSAFPTDAVYGPTPDRQLRLITCGGVFNHALRSYRDNLVVYAVAG